MFDHNELKDLHEKARLRLKDVTAAMQARRVVDWLDTYLPPKDGPEDRFSAELYLDAGNTQDADEAARFLEEAIRQLAPKIIDRAKEIAAQKVAKVS